MKNVGVWSKLPLLLEIGIAVYLLARFGAYLQTGSYDLVQHFLLVDEIMSHGRVRPPPLGIDVMAYYPPASHWLAAILGWVIGSGLVAMVLIAIAAVFGCYLLILRLVGSDSAAGLVLFVVAFYALNFTRSLIGWEVELHFFYPQFVAEVLYFLTLLWMAGETNKNKQAAIVLGAGTLAMWIQPFVAIHILAVGCVFSAFQAVDAWNQSRRTLPISSCVITALVWLLSAAIVEFHPAFTVMRRIASLDHSLDISVGYKHVMTVAVTCGVTGFYNLWRCLAGRARPVDAVLGSAVVAAAALAVMQFVAYKIIGAGSPYAVKKHMFIVLTLGVMNAVRIVAGQWTSAERMQPMHRILISAAACIMSLTTLHSFDLPTAPVLNALTYARHASRFDLPDFVPGNTVYDDKSQHLMANVIVSLVGFHHPFDDNAKAWQNGKLEMRSGSPYTMVRRTPLIDQICDKKSAEGATYMVVDTVCLKRYLVGETIFLGTGGNGWQYATDGWSIVEPWGMWSLGDVGGTLSLTVPATRAPNYELIVNAKSYLAAGHSSQTVVVEANGSDVAQWTFNTNSPAGERRAWIPADLVKSSTLRLVFRSPGAVSPAELGLSTDPRKLGVGISTVVLKDG